MNNTIHEAVQLLVQRVLNLGHEEIPKPERQVIERVAKRLAVFRNINIEYDKSYTFGDRLARRPMITRSISRRKSRSWHCTKSWTKSALRTLPNY